MFTLSKISISDESAFFNFASSEIVCGVRERIENSALLFFSECSRSKEYLSFLKLESIFTSLKKLPEQVAK